jgi:hypothetical protein
MGLLEIAVIGVAFVLFLVVLRYLSGAVIRMMRSSRTDRAAPPRR